MPVPQRPLTDVPSLGQASADKLARIGITNLAALATSNPMAVSTACDNDPDTGRRWIEHARKALEDDGFLQKSVMTASELLKRERAATRLKLGTPKLDEFFHGGLVGGSLYELYGEAHNGKSQFCFQAAVEALRGPGGKVVYIESEGAFEPERIAQMCEARGLDAKDTMDRIEVVSPLTSGEQAYHIRDLQSRVGAEGVRLVIGDSFTGIVRAEMAGREFMSPRSQWLMQNTNILKSVARVYGIPVILTNQVTTDMDVNFGDNKVAFAGTGFAHAVTYRTKIYVPKNSQKRVFKMVDSPRDAQMEEVLWIDEAGYTGEDPRARRK